MNRLRSEVRRGLSALRRAPVPVWIAGLAFLVLFWRPTWTLGRDWWNDPEAGHGLLLAPIAAWLVWKLGRAPNAKAQPMLGMVLLTGAVLLRYGSGLAAELFTMRMSLLGAVASVVIMVGGLRQLRHWWLPTTLLILSVPIPAVVLNSLAFPLQLEASKLGAGMLEWRHVPVALTGNIIHLPGRSLFVTEACSGLRSLTALISLGVLTGGLFLHAIWARAALVILAVPVAMALNGVRVFITGFLVHFVSPSFGEGFMHYSEGWAIFVVAFLILGLVAWSLSMLDRRHRTRTT